MNIQPSLYNGPNRVMFSDVVFTSTREARRYSSTADLAQSSFNAGCDLFSERSSPAAVWKYVEHFESHNTAASAAKARRIPYHLGNRASV